MEDKSLIGKVFGRIKMSNSDCYKITYKGIKLDPYRILHEYGITHPSQSHAIKKLLRAGKSHKPLATDIQECIDTLVRWREMIEEDDPIGGYNDFYCSVCGEIKPTGASVCPNINCHKNEPK